MKSYILDIHLLNLIHIIGDSVNSLNVNKGVKFTVLKVP